MPFLSYLQKNYIFFKIIPIKLVGPFYASYYSEKTFEEGYFRVHFVADAGKLTDIVVSEDGKIKFGFRQNYNTNLIGESFGEKVFGVSEKVSASYPGYECLVSEMYCMFVGGTTVYYQAIVLDSSYIVDKPAN